MMETAGGAKFCIGCKHVATSYSGDYSSFRCFAPQNLESSELNLIDGKTYKTYKFANCVTARKMEEGCGKEGKWWEPKPVEPPLRAESDRSINKTSKKISADDL